MTEEIQVKRGRGRPRKNAIPNKVEAPKQEPKSKFKMRAKPNWENADMEADDAPDRLRIPREMIPDGMDLQWVTDSIFGQQDPQHRADFERKGWTPVHQDDFNGQFNGMFMTKDAPGEINVHGLVLMARPIEFSQKAREADKRRAREAVLIKEAALRSGDIPVTLDAQHPTAINTNRINKTVERIEIPD